MLPVEVIRQAVGFYEELVAHRNSIGIRIHTVVHHSEATFFGNLLGHLTKGYLSSFFTHQVHGLVGSVHKLYSRRVVVFPDDTHHILHLIAVETGEVGHNQLIVLPFL